MGSQICAYKSESNSDNPTNSVYLLNAVILKKVTRTIGSIRWMSFMTLIGCMSFSTMGLAGNKLGERSGPARWASIAPTEPDLVFPMDSFKDKDRESAKPSLKIDPVISGPTKTRNAVTSHGLLKKLAARPSEWTFENGSPKQGTSPTAIWRQEHYPTELRLQATGRVKTPEFQGQFLHYSMRYIVLIRNLLEEAMAETKTEYPQFNVKLDRVTFFKNRDYLASTNIRVQNSPAGQKFLKLVSKKLSQEAAAL